MRYVLKKDLRSPLARSIQVAYNRFIEFLEQIQPKYRKIQKLEGTGGKVSVNDLIAYQIGWGKLLIHWYEAGIAHKTIQMPGEGFTKWDYVGLAKLFYKKYSSNQLKILQETISQILKIVEYEFQTGNLKKIGIWSWCRLSSGKEWPLEKWIIVNTTGPFKRHISLLKKFLSSGKDV